jgi:benzoyl-CoA reductase/2-hydroxyglutaryl-CoA dehydratase subunit BcrC/BadD/HgdB
MPVVGTTSGTVPWELIAAAGCFPLALRRRRGSTPNADELLEPDVFTARIRGIFEGVVSGEWTFLRAIVVPRTSEQEYKLFLYLREIARERPGSEMPPVYLYDLLHTRSREAYEYGLGRTAQLERTLERIAGRKIGREDVAGSIALSNAAREASRGLLRLRRSGPRLGGTEAVALLGAAGVIDRGEFAALASHAATAIAQEPPRSGARLMIAGAPPDDGMLHAVLESLGAVVTAEESGWGVGAHIAQDGDPRTALFEKYYLDTPSPRVFPSSEADRWFEAALTSDVDGVVYYLPPEDYVAGWDYPRRARLLGARGIPHITLRADAAALGEEWLERLRRFVDSAARGEKRTDDR